jgi:hypothetical protein
LAALPAILGTPAVPVMPKLEPMKIAMDGIPELTAPERDKHASELAAPRSGK